jgi:hypothetical protein
LYRTSVPGGRVITVEDLLSSIKDLRLTSKLDITASDLRPVTPIEFLDRVFLNPISEPSPLRLRLTNRVIQPSRVTFTEETEIVIGLAYRRGSNTHFTVSFFYEDPSLFVFRIISPQAAGTFVSPNNTLYRAQFILKNLRLPHDPSYSARRTAITSKELVVKK